MSFTLAAGAAYNIEGRQMPAMAAGGRLSESQIALMLQCAPQYCYPRPLSSSITSLMNSQSILTTGCIHMLVYIQTLIIICWFFS